MKNLILILIMGFGFTVSLCAQNSEPKKIDQPQTEKEQIEWKTSTTVARDIGNTEIKSEQSKVKQNAQSRTIDVAANKKADKEQLTPISNKNTKVHNKLSKQSRKEFDKKKNVNKSIPTKVYNKDVNSSNINPEDKSK
jgi:hypothetical protein